MATTLKTWENEAELFAHFKCKTRLEIVTESSDVKEGYDPVGYDSVTIRI